MTDTNGALEEFTPFHRSRRHGRSPYLAAGGLALGLSVAGAAFMLNCGPAAIPKIHENPVVAAAAILAPPAYVALLDATYSLGAAPGTLDGNAPLGPNFTPMIRPAFEAPPHLPLPEAATRPEAPAASAIAGVSLEPDETLPDPIPDVQQLDSIPLPAPRPPEVGSRPNTGPVRASGRQMAVQARARVATAPPADNRNFIEKLFGLPQPSAGPALAYATPESGVLRIARSLIPGPALPYDRWTAVYDIAAHTVYMPSGARLEAHSGLGDRLDDPRHVGDRNRGATPPHIYALEPRAQLFHGVQALRLNPLGGGDTFGRTGLLAHSYMLGPNGDSNGCVSFKDYNAFLQAYLSGEVKRLVVVPRLV